MHDELLARHRWRVDDEIGSCLLRYLHDEFVSHSHRDVADAEHRRVDQSAHPTGDHHGSARPHARIDDVGLDVGR